MQGQIGAPRFICYAAMVIVANIDAAEIACDAMPI
jgi:hypothetical protein